LISKCIRRIRNISHDRIWEVINRVRR